MDPDAYQQAWRAESSQTRVTVDAESLLNAVQRNQQQLQSTVKKADITTVGIELLLLPVFIIGGIVLASPWTLYLMVLTITWSIVFKLVVRARMKQTPHAPGEPLLNGTKESLALVDHQIWLQGKVFWWTQFPSAIAMLAFFSHVTWLSSQHWKDALGTATLFFVLVFAVYSFTYYWIKRVMRTQYEPHRNELRALLASLSDDSTSEIAGEYPILMKEHYVPSRRQKFLASMCAVVLFAIGIGGIYVGYRMDQDYPRKSPFAAVRWDEAQPEVSIGDEWFKLISLDGIPTSEIIEFSQHTYADKWQKRFEEDLVELLTRMGNPPGDSVTLVVQSLTSSETRTLNDVPMTRANRQAIRDAAKARQESAQVALAELIPDLRREKRLVGLAAMVMVDGEVVDSAVDGERKKGSGVPLEIGDQWHLGSVTKSITATMIARLVESGQLEWTDTVGEIFSDAGIHEDWKTVSLKQLLNHTAGAPANFSFLSPRDRPAPGPERMRARRDAVLKMISKKPDYPPGDGMTYSNAGYTIAGAMAEQATDESWEDLVAREVFEPLALAGAGFGPPTSPNKTLDQPRGHSRFLGQKVAAADNDDNTPIIGPSGSVHMTLEDLCTYATEHLRGELGEGTLLTAESYKRLHTPERNKYAYGWIRFSRSISIPYTYYWHNGSNTMWYALLVFIPDKDMVVAVTSNDGDIGDAEAAAWEIVSACAKQTHLHTKRAVPIDEPDRFRSNIDAFLNAARKQVGFSGAVLVARSGIPVYEGAFGFSHLDSKEPNTLDTPFRIASLSKQFTAAAILRLEAEGRLRIDDPVNQYVSEFADEPYRDITIHHLLTHTSGLPRTAKGLKGETRWNSMSKSATPVDDYVRLAAEMPLEFAPGTDYLYSNFGYRILSALIARVTGRDYADFMEEEIFKPLGMNDTGVARITRPSSEDRIAQGLRHMVLPFGIEPRYFNGEFSRNYGAGYGSGGIYTSANDLLRWDRVLAADEFLSKSQKETLFQPILGNYACGWIVKESGLDGRLYQMHSGGNEGFFSQMMRVPEDDLVIVAVGNVDATEAFDEMLEQLFRLCRSLPYQVP